MHLSTVLCSLCPCISPQFYAVFVHASVQSFMQSLSMHLSKVLCSLCPCNCPQFYEVFVHASVHSFMQSLSMHLSTVLCSLCPCICPQFYAVFVHASVHSFIVFVGRGWRKFVRNNWVDMRTYAQKSSNPDPLFMKLGI